MSKIFGVPFILIMLVISIVLPILFVQIITLRSISEIKKEIKPVVVEVAVPSATPTQTVEKAGPQKPTSATGSAK